MMDQLPASTAPSAPVINLNAILALAYRDLLKFLRDRPRLVSSFVFPLVFVGIVGRSMQANLGGNVGFDYLTFTFTGVLAQTLFQSASTGIISLIEDRENDFSQEIFVAPVSRYAIIFGKILGESLVALTQGIGIVALGAVLGVSLTPSHLLGLLPVSLLICLFGGAFGVLILANLKNQRTANQIFPFIMLPQYFLGGVFTPVKVLPWYLEVASRISPLRYAVDITRNVFYAGTPDYPRVVLQSFPANGAVIAALFGVFLVTGTALFVRQERNR